ncbi:helix-turn-helix domain-containing protein [Amycolatopsis sp. NPDC049252]|uniref:helix-turn-helix domain-containing protein n=1 Tax=Amycolatopsis sp. NPDC049252 TaxID=3363933 RepID=UPI00371AB093
MKGLLLRLSGLDADAENAVRVIGFFDRLITERASLDVLVRSTARLAGCPAGVHAPAQGLALRADPDAGVTAPGRVPAGAAARPLEGGVVVWVCREGAPTPLDDILLERFAIATAVLLEHTSVPLPALGDPALVELVLSEGIGTAERSRALHLLGLDTTARLRVLATTGADLPGRSAAFGDVRAVLTTDGPETAPPGARIGVGPAVAALDLARSWQAARTALRFTAGAEPVVWSDRLGSLAALAGRLTQADLADFPDIQALDRLAGEAHGDDILAALNALCATGSARKAAAVLHRHHSTMPARLARAGSVLGFDVDSPTGRLRLHLALMLRRLRDAGPSEVDAAPNG